MPGLVPGIHVFDLAKNKTWMPAPSAGMTEESDSGHALPRPFVLQNIEPDVAIDHVDQAAVVERHVVALRC